MVHTLDNVVVFMAGSRGNTRRVDDLGFAMAGKEHCKIPIRSNFWGLARLVERLDGIFLMPEM